MIFPVETNRKAKQINSMNILRFSLQPSNFVNEVLQGEIDLPQQDSGNDSDHSLWL